MAFGADDIIYIYVGSMIARALSPVIKSGWEWITGKEKKDEDKRIRIVGEQRESAVTLQILSHNQRLEFAEKQFKLNMQDWATKTYYKECWPLRNPFEMQFGIKPVSDDFTLLGAKIIPCRIISGLLDTSHPLSKTINGNLSSFLVNNYASNSIHSVISDVGAWREDIPVNDASINYLYAGFKGQPVMVITPSFINNGTTIIFKLWSWGLGEDLNYPAGFEFGRLNLRPLHLQTIYEETKRMMVLAAKMDFQPSKVYSQQLQHNISIIKSIDERKLSGEFENQMLLYLVDAKEIEENVRNIMGQKVSGIYCCLAGMYADSYHLLEYRTLPKLPSLLHQLPGIDFVTGALKNYYIELLANLELIEKNKELVAQIYLDVADAFSKLEFSFTNREQIITPFTIKALSLFIQVHDQDETGEGLDRLPVLRSIIKGNMEYQTSDIVKRTNQILERIKIDKI